MVNSASKKIKTTQRPDRQGQSPAGKTQLRRRHDLKQVARAFLLNKAAGINTVLVPYNGSAEVTQALLTKSVDFTLDGTSAASLH